MVEHQTPNKAQAPMALGRVLEQGVFTPLCHG